MALRYIEHDRDRRPSTVGDYRNTVRCHLLPAFGADTPVAAITTDDIHAFREPDLWQADADLPRATSPRG